MDWIKKNYALFCLGIVALVLLVVSAVLIWNASVFNQTFASIQSPVQQNNKVQTVDQTVLESANAALVAPKIWSPKQNAGLLFVSEKFLLNKDGAMVSPRDRQLHPPVPNEWFEKNNLDILDNDILNADPDKDGFSNYDEWVGKTDPNDPKSHPAYVTKLKLKEFIKRQFRLRVNAYDGDPAKPEEMTFQINTVDLRQPTQFRKLNEMIEGTRFKLMKFTLKKTTDANEIEHDISELIVEHVDTKDQVTLVMNKDVDSPDSFAKFKYLWDGSEMIVKKEKTFTLKPEIDVQYKLIDIQEGEATIQNLKTQEKIKIPRLAE